MKTPQIAFILILIFITGCTVAKEDPAPASAAPLCSTTVAEISECTTSTSYSPAVTITGTAQFFKRKIRVLGNPDTTSLTLGAPITSALPIKFAEVRVLDGSGNVIQCGKTDATGLVKALDGTSALQIPNTAGNYTVQVLSRTNHTIALGGGKPTYKVYASVKTDICTNGIHTLSKVVTSDGSTPISVASSDLTAFARESETSGKIQGGAFNILNNIVSTYEYIGSNTGTDNLSCLSPKFHVYWQAGFNPAQYIYPSEDPSTLDHISFYLRGYSELYINGGKLGNVSTVDTDHFDDSVIIHETGHRIEDACGKMESPGGSHNGLFRIDPRLAWSEGWGNYLAAHIVRNKITDINPQASADLTSYDGWLYYLDTKGYSDGGGSASELIKFNLKKSGSNPEVVQNRSPVVAGTCGTEDFCFDKVDAAANPGEGHFREVSIARSLFKITNTCTASTCTGSGATYFPKLWQGFVDMKNSTYPFRSSIRLYDRMTAAFGGTMPTDIDNILNTDEAQQRHGNSGYTSTNLTWPSYGIKLVPSVSACTFEIQPKSETDNVTNSLSDQRYSNHYYHIDKATSLAGISTVTLSAVTNTAGTTGISFGMKTHTENFIYPTSTSTYLSSISSSSLTSGTPYLLNVRAFTSGVTVLPTTRYTYTLTTDIGGYLCPSPTF
ncbi:hypothetical protein K2P97_00935 [bacterium]|nr:hypothetical protein [bacterium]